MNERPQANSRSRTTLGIGLLGAFLCWASLPPWNLWWLGWLAPVPWLWLARLPQLPGRRPYLALWLAGAAFWTATNHWLRLPHPATSIGWFALSFYLACYVPLMVGLCRVAARRGIGIVVAGPIVWVAADQARAYVFSGFSMSSLCHSQYRRPELIQCADLCGEFGLTFVMVLFAATIARILPLPGARRWSWRWAFAALFPVVFVWQYAVLSWPGASTETPRPKPMKVALIQGSIESEVRHDPSKPDLIYENYMALTRRAMAEDPSVDLIVWPEAIFPYPYWIVGDDARPKPGDPWTVAKLRDGAAVLRDKLAQTAQTFDRPMLVGITAVEFGPETFRGYNTALYVDARGKPLGRFDKRHLVMFGEYIPFADRFPWLYEITPLAGGVGAGKQAESFELDDLRLAPNICYESALARVIRRQVVELRERGVEPQVLVNLTNDSWFRGSSELDLHLACSVFRAVEMRKPHLIAANTGISAQIDGRGRIVRQGPRRAEDVLIAEVSVASRGPSLYLLYGDWLAWSCLLAASVLAAVGPARTWQIRRSAKAAGRESP